TLIAEDAAEPQRGRHDQREVAHVAGDSEGPSRNESVPGRSRRRPPGRRRHGKADENEPQWATSAFIAQSDARRNPRQPGSHAPEGRHQSPKPAEEYEHRLRGERKHDVRQEVENRGSPRGHTTVLGHEHADRNPASDGKQEQEERAPPTGWPSGGDWCRRV